MEENEKPIVRRSISISKEMDDWLKEHPDVNSSALFRQTIYELQAGESIHVSMYGLGFFILITTCFSFLLWLLLPIQLTGILMLFLLSIVVVILFKSVILFSQYQKEVKNWKKKDYSVEKET